MKAHLAGIGFATIFGVSFIFSKLALSELTPFGLLSLRFIIAFSVMHGLVLLKVIRIKYDHTMWRLALPVVIAQPIMYFSFETIGLSLIPSSLAGILIALIPLMTLLLVSFRFRQPIVIKQLLWMLLSFSGVITLTLLGSQDPTSSGSWLGVVLVFVAVLSAAGFNILSKEALKTMNVLTLTYLMMGVGALGFTIAHSIEVLLQGQSWHLSIWLQKPSLSVPLLYLGVVASIGGFFLINYALSKLSSASASVYANLATVVSIIVGVVVLSEVFGLWHVFAAMAVIIGVRGSVMSGRSSS